VSSPVTSIPDQTESPSPETIGHKSETIPVELSTRFLEHFSEQLYSSPQKAFEELISNGWDAGASCVDIRIATDLQSPTATMSVLDNGGSMNADGLRELWHIAFSPKKDKPEQHGRHVIGKFGIGKLATYVLADKLTYICKASDGVIRRVTMNYAAIDLQQPSDKDRLISELKLDIYEVNETEIEEALKSIYGGDITLEYINNGILPLDTSVTEDEFRSPKSVVSVPSQGTWTLVVLSGIKKTGRNLKLGVLRRMLEAALPLGSEMSIRLNGDVLTSSKIDFPTIVEWTIGPDLAIDNVEIYEDDNGLSEASSPKPQADSAEASQPKALVIPVSSGTSPVPFIELPGIGRVTGRVRLFIDPISGGKSDERGASNGFHINVLGRVVNQSDPSFGEVNLSHAAWARFRMTVRADGLNDFITTNREQFKDQQELKIFRAFLRKVFNKARTNYDSDQNAGLPDGGDVLVRSLGVLSLSPLRNIVSEALRTQPQIPDMFDETGISDKEEKRRSWRDNTADHIKNALDQVKYERVEDDSFVKFRISDNTIVVNKDHPFVSEHSRTKAEKELVRTVAMVNLLSDLYALDIGVSPIALESIQRYRDQLMRFRALQRRQSGTYIAKLLLQTQHDSANSKLLEAVLSDALRYLGFQVRDLAKSGQPEGIASAYAIPSLSTPTQDNQNPPLYTVAFDAKSSKHSTAQTGNINLDGIADHRKSYNADYSLVVAPGFTGEAILRRCTEQKVTPMAAHDLGKMLEYTVEYGAIPVTKMREVFSLYEPQAVTSWVQNLQNWFLERRPLTIDIFLKALEILKDQVPDVLAASTVALECRRSLKAVSVKDEDVIAVAQGLSILIPDLVGIDGDKIVVNASAERVAAAVASQLEKLHNEQIT
jgi:hypothetical protein